MVSGICGSDAVVPGPDLRRQSLSQDIAWQILKGKCVADHSSLVNGGASEMLNNPQGLKSYKYYLLSGVPGMVPALKIFIESR